MNNYFKKNLQFYKFASYGFLKNLRFFEPFIILAFRAGGLSFLKIGILFGVREVFSNIFEIPTGIIADSLGRRKAMIFSFISYIISLLIFSFSNNYYFFLIAMVFFGMGEAFRSGTHKALILEYLKINKLSDIKVHYYGATRSFSQLGSAFSSIIAMIIIFFSMNYKIIFLATIIPYILELFLLYSYPKELDGKIIYRKDKSLAYNLRKQFSGTFKNFINIFKDKNLLKVIINSSLFDAFFKSTKDYIQPVLKLFVSGIPILLTLNIRNEKKVAISVGITYFIIYLMTSFASKNAGMFVKKINSLNKAVNLTFFIGGIFIFFISVFLNFNIIIITILFFLLYYILINIRRPMCVSYISDYIHSEIMATGLSVEAQFKAIFVAVFSPALGLIIDKTNLQTGFFIFFVIYMISFGVTKLK